MNVDAKTKKEAKYLLETPDHELTIHSGENCPEIGQVEDKIGSNRLLGEPPIISSIDEVEDYDDKYTDEQGMPVEYINEPLTSEEEDENTYDYDLDSEDESFIEGRTDLQITPREFEQLINKMEMDNMESCLFQSDWKSKTLKEVYAHWERKCAKLNGRKRKALVFRVDNRSSSSFLESEKTPYVAFKRIKRDHDGQCTEVHNTNRSRQWLQNEREEMKTIDLKYFKQEGELKPDYSPSPFTSDEEDEGDLIIDI